jgi:hypothetical protein
MERETVTGHLQGAEGITYFDPCGIRPGAPTPLSISEPACATAQVIDPLPIVLVTCAEPALPCAVPDIMVPVTLKEISADEVLLTTHATPLVCKPTPFILILAGIHGDVLWGGCTILECAA